MATLQEMYDSIRDGMERASKEGVSTIREGEDSTTLTRSDHYALALSRLMTDEVQKNLNQSAAHQRPVIEFLIPGA